MKRLNVNPNLEDYKNNFFGGVHQYNPEQAFNRATTLLKQRSKLLAALNKVIKDWPDALAVRLNDTELDKETYLLCAACTEAYKIPYNVTEAALESLSDSEVEIALNLASNAIDTYLNNND